MSWNKLNKLYENMHEEILRDVARRILSTEEKLGKPAMTESARWQIYMLQESGELYEDIVNKVSKYANLNKSVVSDIFKEASLEVYQDEKSKTLDKFKSLRINSLISRGINQTISEVNNLTMTTAVDSSNIFKNELNRAYLKIINGTENYETAIDKSIKNLAQDTAKVTYPTGYKSHLVTSVRRAVLTSVNQVAGQLAIENARELGTNLMEISAHAGARPSHSLWQGRIVSLDPNYHGKEYLTLNDIGFGSPSGFKGCNCRHNWHPYFEGSDRAYSKEDLNKLNNQTITYNNQEVSLYDAKLYQRKLEYDVRKAKNEYIICDEMLNHNDPTPKQVERYIHAKTKLTEKQRKLSEYLKKTNLQRNNTSIGIKLPKTKEINIDFNQKNASKISSEKSLQSHDVLKNQPINGIINVEIDELTPCLFKSSTNKYVDTIIKKMDNSKELKKLTKGWNFDWTIEKNILGLYSVDNKERLQGLMSYELKKDNQAVYIKLLENNPDNVKNKTYTGVGGHLIAEACKISFDNGFDGYVYLDAKTNLIEHYKNYGAKQFGLTNRMIFETEKSKKLMEVYYGKKK